MRRIVPVCILVLVLNAQFVSSQVLRKIADDDNSHYTNIGNIGLTISNYGVIGKPLSGSSSWPPAQPSCEFPFGSHSEHLDHGAIWVGGVPRHQGSARVSTGAVDNSFTSSTALGVLMTNEVGAAITQRSSLGDSPYFNRGAVSHQDYVMDFTDIYTHNPETNDSVYNNNHDGPLGIGIHLETYAWNFPFANFFVVLNYTIKNVSADTIDRMYVGLYSDAVVRNTVSSGRPAGSSYYSDIGKGYIDSLRLSYTFEFTNQPSLDPKDGVLKSYYSVKLLGSTPFPLKKDSAGNTLSVPLDSLGDLSKDTYYNGWRFNVTSGTGEVYFSPDFDDNPAEPFRGKYQRLSTMMPRPNINALQTPNGTPVDGSTNGIANSGSGMADLISVGPFQPLAPRDSLQVAFAVVCALKNGNDFNENNYIKSKGDVLRKTLYSNATRAQQAYNGEDNNGNNQLDPGEDINGDGKLSRYILPQPPRVPRVRAEIEDQHVTIYWDRTQSEESVDPISHLRDFEGYRVYRSNAGADITNPASFTSTMQLVGEFDRRDDTIGYNTGFDKIRLSSAKKFDDGDTVEYWYQFPPKNDPVTNLNGWQYLYGVSAFDQGDTTVASLESAKVIERVIPGTSISENSSEAIGVYPNPYYVNAAWDAGTERTRKIYFTHLPARAEIKIFTITGDLVADLQHDAATYDGSGIKWFDNFSSLNEKVQMSGGEHAWDLVTKYDQAISTGLYLFSVKNIATGQVKRGKFVIVK